MMLSLVLVLASRGPGASAVVRRHHLHAVGRSRATCATLVAAHSQRQRPTFSMPEPLRRPLPTSAPLAEACSLCRQASGSRPDLRWRRTGFSFWKQGQRSGHSPTIRRRSMVTFRITGGRVMTRARATSYPSYCAPEDAAFASGVDERHSGYEALISAINATNVTVTGHNGTIDGQGAAWWPMRQELLHGRPHLLFFSRCSYVQVSNLTLRSSPFWTVRF